MTGIPTATPSPTEDADIQAVRYFWEHAPHPRVAWSGREPIRVKLPRSAARPGNKWWLRGEMHHKMHRIPQWNASKEQWEWAKGKEYRAAAIERCVERFGAVLVFQWSSGEKEVCAPSCWNSRGAVEICECSCGGTNHGHGNNPGRFKELEDYFAVRYGPWRVIVALYTADGAWPVASADLSPVGGKYATLDDVFDRVQVA